MKIILLCSIFLFFSNLPSINAKVIFSKDSLIKKNQGHTEVAEDPASEDYFVPFPASPSWVSDGKYVVSSLNAGDFDRDGDLDLSASTYASSEGGEPLNNYLFNNENGTLGARPSWKSTVQYYSLEAFFADFNNDGKLDLYSANGGKDAHPDTIFFNNGKSIEETPSWVSQTNLSTICAEIGDINQDGFLDIITGNLCYFTNCPGVQLVGYISQNKAVENKYNWLSGYVLQNIGLALDDFDNDGLKSKTVSFSGDGKNRVFYLKEIPIRKIVKIVVNGIPLEYKNYLFDRRNGWVLLKNAPSLGENNIKMEYVYSTDLDLAASPIVGTIKLHLNENGELGKGYYKEIGAGAATSNKILRFVDIDNDGDLDLFSGGSAAPMAIYLNEKGKFENTPSWYSRDASPSLQDAIFSDLDKDGDMDLITSHFPSKYGIARVYLNRRNILDTIPDWVVPYNGKPGTAITVTDINGDANPDIVLGYGSSKIEAFINTLK